MVCVASNAFGRGHMKARVLEFVGCHNILWKTVLTLSFPWVSWLLSGQPQDGSSWRDMVPQQKTERKQAARDVD